MQGAGCRVQGVGCRVLGAGRRVQGAGCRVQGAGCRVQGEGCRVKGGADEDAHGHVHPRVRQSDRECTGDTQREGVGRTGGGLRVGVVLRCRV